MTERDTAPDHDRPEPSLRQLLERIEAAVSLAVDTRADVAAARAELAELAELKEDVKAVRHAAALAADDALAHRSEVSRMVERLDRIDSRGCGRYWAHLRAGNGGG